MKRREFIMLVGGAAAAWPIAVHGQQAGGIRRIGSLSSSTEGEPEGWSRIAAFQDALQRLGWSNGTDVRFDYRWGAQDPAQARDYAAELISLKPDLILARGSQITEELVKQTRAIPVIFVGVSDPVSSGLVASMAHPGGNLTGFVNYEFSIGGKWLETLKDVAPETNRVLVLRNTDRGNEGLLAAIQTAALSFGITVVAAVVRHAADIEPAFTEFAQASRGGLIVLPGSSRLENRDLIVDLAAQHRLPAIYAVRPFIVSGGLMSFDTDALELHRRAASYADRILRGERPGDLPVQVPTKYELVINLKAAKALGLTVPLPLLARADEVIE